MVVLFACGIGSCTQSVRTEQESAEIALASIERRVENLDHQAVIEEANAFLLQFPGHSEIDRVMFILGQTYLETEDYVQAESYFSRIQQQFPESGFADDAYFLLGEAYLKQSLPAHYDQEMTLRALGQFLRFVELYPQSELMSRVEEKVLFCRERLAHKRFLNGKLYAKLGYWRAALQYFEEVAADFSDTVWGSESLLRMGYALEKLGRRDDARAAYQSLSKDPAATEEQRKEALERLSRLNGQG